MAGEGERKTVMMDIVAAAAAAAAVVTMVVAATATAVAAATRHAIALVKLVVTMVGIRTFAAVVQVRLLAHATLFEPGCFERRRLACRLRSVPRLLIIVPAVFFAEESRLAARLAVGL